MSETPVKSGAKVENGRFKPGYDPRRWLKGRGRKPANQKKAEEILLSLIWDVLSEDIEHPITHEKIDRFRAMIRSMTTSKQSADRQAILDRIAGKVQQDVDITTDGQPVTITVQYVKPDDKAE